MTCTGPHPYLRDNSQKKNICIACGAIEPMQTIDFPVSELIIILSALAAVSKVGGGSPPNSLLQEMRKETGLLPDDHMAFGFQKDAADTFLDNL